MVTTLQFDDRALVRSAQSGSVDAFAELTERYSLMVYRVSLRMLGNPTDAEDLAQDVMVAAWRGLGNFRADAQYSSWLYRIVTRRALNHLTRTRTCLPLADDEQRAAATPGPVEQAEQNATVDAVTRAVMLLPTTQRAVVVLHHFEGLTYAQTATATGTTVPSVRSHLFRARQTLTVTLAGIGEAVA